MGRSTRLSPGAIPGRPGSVRQEQTRDPVLDGEEIMPGRGSGETGAVSVYGVDISEAKNCASR